MKKTIFLKFYIFDLQGSQKKIYHNKVKIPIISGGGCGLAKDFTNGFLIGKADAICAGSFFAHRDQNLVQTRAQIVNAGVNIRVQN